MEVINEYLSHQPHKLPDEVYAEALDENPTLASIIFTRMTIPMMNAFRLKLQKLVKRKHQIVDKYLLPVDEKSCKNNWNFIQWRFGDILDEKPTGTYVLIHVGYKMRLNYIPNIKSVNSKFITKDSQPYMIKYEPTKQSKYVEKVGDGAKYKVYIDYDTPASLGHYHRQLYPLWKEDDTITKTELKAIMNGCIYWTMSENDINAQKKYTGVIDGNPIDVNAILSNLNTSGTPKQFIKNIAELDPLSYCLLPVLKEYWDDKPILIAKLKAIYGYQS